MKKLLRFLSFAIFASAILSCEKENEYPKKYTQYSYLPGEIKAFTKSGEIGDRNTINNFINGFEDYFWSNPSAMDPSEIEIEILSDKKARIIMDPENIFDFDLVRRNGILYFQSLDTAFSHSDMTNDRFMYFPLYMSLLPLSTGMQGAIYIPCIYTIESNGEIHLPMASYLEKIYSPGGQLYSSQGIGNYNNIINTSYLNKIQTWTLTDTFVFQDNLIVFKEK